MVSISFAEIFLFPLPGYFIPSELVFYTENRRPRLSRRLRPRKTGQNGRSTKAILINTTMFSWPFIHIRNICTAIDDLRHVISKGRFIVVKDRGYNHFSLITILQHFFFPFPTLSVI